MGVFQGGTECTTLFNTVFQMLLDTVESPDNLEHCAYRFKADKSVALLHAAYADDYDLVTKTAAQNQRLLSTCESWFDWTRGMRMKPVKCISFAAKCFSPKEKGRFQPYTKARYSPYDPLLTIYGQPVAAIGEGISFKYLGKFIYSADSATKDRALIKSRVMQWISLIDSTPLLNAHRCWLYSEYLVAKASWWLTVCDCSLTFCRSLDQAIRPYLKKWAGIPRRGANAALLFCGGRERPGLRLRLLSVAWRAMQVVKWRILRDSTDPRSQFIFRQQEHKEHTSLSDRFAPTVSLPFISALAQQPSAPKQRLGLGLQQAVHHTKVSAFRYFSQRETQEQLEHLKRLTMQGKWAEWDDVAATDYTWQKLLWGTTDSYLKYLLNAPNNSLPTADNLARWSNSAVDLSCPCCGKHHPTLLHILNNCTPNLGRYRWRHDQVLAVLCQAVTQFCATLDTPTPTITFIKAGERPTQPPDAQLRRPHAVGILSRATDWVVLSDADGALSFPAHIAANPSNQRPDLVLYSDASRTVILIELTVPAEENEHGAYASSKPLRYRKLHSECTGNRWQAYLFTVVVGSLGGRTSSLTDCLRQLGFDRALAKRTVAEAAATARRCSYWIYCRRALKQWEAPF